MKILLPITGILAFVSLAQAQINTGSNGNDGAFNPSLTPSNNVVYVDMADHPDGIYQFTSVNIPFGLTVFFIPNAKNTPVVWLVQSNCVINGTVDLSGQRGNGAAGSTGGPGGFKGGSPGPSAATAGEGPGGGGVTSPTDFTAGNASYGSLGGTNGAVGKIYGNNFLIPLIGGSGGGGNSGYAFGAGGGGGGAILIASSGSIQLNGRIAASGGDGAFYSCCYTAGGGSGGAVRLVATTISGGGVVEVNGGRGGIYGYSIPQAAGLGRVRFDTYANSFGGRIDGVFTQGFQPIIIPTAGQGAQLNVVSIGGVPVSASPSGVQATPDAIISAQQNNPVPIVVHCSNIPLNTQITVSVKPASGATISATGLNNSGTLSSSTATISINMPRGGGILYATATN